MSLDFFWGSFVEAKYLKLTADDLVHLFTARLGEIKGEFGNFEKMTLCAFAVDLAIRFGASTAVHDELIGFLLDNDPSSGMDHAILLAPRASPKAKERIMVGMFSMFAARDVDRVIGYAKDVLGRDLTFAECKGITRWFRCCDNDSDKKGRQKIAGYIQKKYPEKMEEVNEYFRGEDQFWRGVGSFF